MEIKWLESLKKRFGSIKTDTLLLGIGDDAAVFAPMESPFVVTVDMLTDGVDFLLEQTPPDLIGRIGRKALAVNLSDIAAMGAVPFSVVIAVALPKEGAAQLADALFDGILPLAQKYNVSIAGGDTNTWSEGLVISITAFGMCTEKGPIKRSGAKAGDQILVTGAFGGSILGRQFTFEPRINEILHLHRHYEIHAAIDVSDGLSLDLSRLAAASHLGAVLFENAVPVHPDAFRMDDSKTPIEHALSDGEDFELILAVPQDVAEKLIREQPLDVPITNIGFFQSELGLWIEKSGGKRQEINPSGYEHI